MTRWALIAFPFVLLATGCVDRDGNARRDVARVTRELQEAGLTAEIVIAPSTQEADAAWQASFGHPDASVVVVAPGYIAARYAPALKVQLTEEQMRARGWAVGYMQAGPAQAARAAARGMLQDFMEAGLVRPGPLPPLPPEPDMGDVGPMEHPLAGAAILCLVIFCALVLRSLVRRSGPTHAVGGVRQR